MSGFRVVLSGGRVNGKGELVRHEGAGLWMSDVIEVKGENAKM
jgi:hypothetical protein